MSIDLGNNPVGTPPTPTEQTQLRASFGLGAADTVEFGALGISQLNFPDLTTSELNAVTDATQGDTYFDSARGQFVRFTGTASYDVITSRSYEPTLKTTKGAAMTLPATRLFESGVLAASPDVFAPTDLLLIYSGKNPSATLPTYYLYHDGSQGPAGWYDANDVNSGHITSAVFTPDTLMQLQLGGVNTPFIFDDYAINTSTSINLASASLKTGATYSFDFSVGFVDLLGSNAKITVDYDALLDSSGFLSLSNKDTRSKTTLLDAYISSPEETTELVLSTASFAGVAGSTLGMWKISGTLTPSSSGTLTINLGQGAASVNPLFFSAPSMKITMLVD